MRIDNAHEDTIDRVGGSSTHPAHPAQRPAEPEHPMLLNGGVVPGDVQFMAKCMIEELLQVGLTFEEIERMSHDANYQALYAARASLGPTFDELLESTFQRIGAHRYRTVEHEGDVQSVSLTISTGTGNEPE